MLLDARRRKHPPRRDVPFANEPLHDARGYLHSEDELRNEPEVPVPQQASTLGTPERTSFHEIASAIMPNGPVHVPAHAGGGIMSRTTVIRVAGLLVCSIRPPISWWCYASDDVARRPFGL